ncbi:hypothetical protein EDC01DRAFT_262582 [Geopyxis carbonaria]|nr:hypothetical protein EDC01DRAFT_262582 [Geopyxis carbonaria]
MQRSNLGQTCALDVASVPLGQHPIAVEMMWQARLSRPPAHPRMRTPNSQSQALSHRPHRSTMSSPRFSPHPDVALESALASVHPDDPTSSVFPSSANGRYQTRLRATASKPISRLVASFRHKTLASAGLDRGTPSGRHRVYTRDEKLEVLAFFEWYEIQHGTTTRSPTQGEVAKFFGIPATTIQGWQKNESRIVNPAVRFRRKKPVVAKNETAKAKEVEWTLNILPPMQVSPLDGQDALLRSSPAGPVPQSLLPVREQRGAERIHHGHRYAVCGFNGSI